MVLTSRAAFRRHQAGCIEVLPAKSFLHGHTSAFPRRVSPGLCKSFRPERGGRRECRVLAAPAVSRAISAKSCAHEHTGTVGAFRHSLRSGFTAYAALSLETNSSCLHRCRLDGRSSPVGNHPPDSLTPATGARTTRFCRTLQRRTSCAASSLTEIRPANMITRPTLPRPPQPVPTIVTMADAPLAGRDGVNCRGDLG
jgi:hypothetical protein